MRQRRGARTAWVSIWSNCSARTGFLLHSFLSPISNRRSDSYGGTLANRMRYPLEVAAAIREVWPRRKTLGMRITGTDWVDGGITPDEAGIFAGKLRDLGFDYVCVSSGGISPAARPAIAPGLPGAALSTTVSISSRLPFESPTLTRTSNVL
jgi:2,4-dienoyl-CoA reductase-like NADH-dependent reductase (Old Yellow Enzyme family)